MLCWKDEAVGGEEMSSRWLMALRFLVCLGKHALWDIGCDPWEIFFQHLSLFFSSLFFSLLFKDNLFNFCFLMCIGVLPEF